MPAEMFSEILFGLVLRQAPILIVTGVGLWFAISRKRSMGRASTWASFGFALLIGNSLIGGVVRIMLALMESGSAAPSGEQAADLAAWSVLVYLLYIGGVAALTRAVFLGRSDIASAA